MVRLVVGVFLVLHGLVHLLYLGQSQRLFALEPGMVWPDGSWALSGLAGEHAARLLASASCALAAAGLVAGGLGLLAGQRWSRPLVVGASAFSAAVFLLFWDGALQNLDNKGLFGILINVAIVTAVLVFRWPALEG